MARRSYSGGAQPTTLASGINSTSTTIAAVALVNWPNPANGPFFAVIDKGTPTEEKILCTAVNGNDLTVLRGQDGTIARDHSAGDGLEHCHTATDADEANAHVHATSGVHGMPVGDGFVYRDAAQTIKNKTLDFGVGGGNQATNLPRAASPEIDSALTAEANARIAGDAALAQADADHLAAVDPHPQYLTPAEGSALILAALPIGSITMFAGATVPPGWLPCDGTVVSTTTYSVLAAVLGTRYNTGSEGANNVRLPNFNGRVPKGVGSNGTNTYGLAASGGADTRVIGSANLPKHQHGLPQHTHTFSTNAGQGGHTHPINIDRTSNSDPHRHSFVNAAAGGIGTSVSDPNEAGVVGSGTGSNHVHSGTTANSPANTKTDDGAFTNTAFDLRNPYLTVNFIIRAL